MSTQHKLSFKWLLFFLLAKWQNNKIYKTFSDLKYGGKLLQELCAKFGYTQRDAT